MWGSREDPDLYRCAMSIAGVASLRREVDDFGGSLMSGESQDDWIRMTLISPLFRRSMRSIGSRRRCC